MPPGGQYDRMNHSANFSGKGASFLWQSLLPIKPPPTLMSWIRLPGFASTGGQVAFAFGHVSVLVTVRCTANALLSIDRRIRWTVQALRLLERRVLFRRHFLSVFHRP